MWRKAPNVLTPNVLKDNTAVYVFAKHNLRAGRNQTTVTVDVTSCLPRLRPRKRARSLKSYFPLARENSVLSSHLPWLWLAKLSQTLLYNRHILSSISLQYHDSLTLDMVSVLSSRWSEYRNKCRVQTETQKKIIILSMSAVKTWKLLFYYTQHNSLYSTRTFNTLCCYYCQIPYVTLPFQTYAYPYACWIPECQPVVQSLH